MRVALVWCLPRLLEAAQLVGRDDCGGSTPARAMVMLSCYRHGFLLANVADTGTASDLIGDWEVLCALAVQETAHLLLIDGLEEVTVRICHVVSPSRHWHPL